MDIVISQPLPAGTVLTLDGLDRDANPVPLRREELDEPTDRVTLSDVPSDYPVLSLIVEPGDSAAFTHKPFFKVGATYTENRPFAAPEARRVFRVVATDRHPSKSYLIAFGYEQGGSGRWHRASLDQDDWDRGWVEVPQQPDGVEADEPQYVECPPDCSGCVCAALGHMAPCSHCSENHFNRGERA